VPAALHLSDLYELPRLAAQTAAAWTIPESFWVPLSRSFGRLYAVTHPRQTRANARCIGNALDGSGAPGSARQYAVDYWSNRYLERFQYLKAWRPGGWRPEIHVRGRDHAAAATRAGHGIIFWSGKFAFSALVGKIALHRLGLAVAHFSRPYHGFSTSRFGIRYLNAVRRQPESWYLDERLMVPEHRTRDALEGLQRRLRAGGMVSFTIGGHGRRRDRAPLLGAAVELATGPFTLARRTGAVVLPVSTLRTGPRCYTVDIGPPLADGRAVDGAPDLSSLTAALAPHILRDPGQWRGWRYVLDEGRGQS